MSKIDCTTKMENMYLNAGQSFTKKAEIDFMPIKFMQIQWLLHRQKCLLCQLGTLLTKKPYVLFDPVWWQIMPPSKSGLH